MRLRPQSLQIARQFLEETVGHDLINQRLTRVFLILLAAPSWQQHLYLYAYKLCRKQQKVAGNFQIHALGIFQVHEVLIGQFIDGDVVDIDLVFFQQMHQ